MHGIRNILCQKLNIVRLISVSVVIGVVMILSFAVQMDEEKGKVEKKDKAVGYTYNLTGKNYCIVCDAATGKLYVTTADTDLTKEYAEDNAGGDTYYHKDIKDTPYYTPISQVITEARGYLDANNKLSSSYTKLAELPADLAQAISVEMPDKEGELPKIVVNSLYFSTNLEYSMVMPTDCGNVNCNRSCEFCKTQSALVDGGSTKGDSDGRNGVRMGCALYVYGNAEIELEGDSLLEINDPGIRGGENNAVVANSGDIEAGYGIYCDGELSVLDGDNDGSLGIEFDSLYYYDTGIGDSGKTFANYDCGIFSRNGINIEGSISVATTKEGSGTTDENQIMKTRGYNGIATYNGDININKGRVQVANNVMVAAADSSKSYKAFAANPDTAVPTDSFGYYKGVVVLGNGNININRSYDEPLEVSVSNYKKVENMYAVVTYNGNIENTKGKIVVYNEDAVRSYIYIDINALTNNQYEGILGKDAVLREYETIGGLYGIYVMNPNNKVIFNNGEYILDSFIDKDANGVEKAGDDGQSKYIWSLYGIYSEGEVEMNDSEVNISGFSESESVGIYSKKSQELKNSDIVLNMKVYDTTWKENSLKKTLENSLPGVVNSILKVDDGISAYVTGTFYNRADGIFLDNSDSSYKVNISNCNLDIGVSCKRVEQYTRGGYTILGTTIGGTVYKYLIEKAHESESVINVPNSNLIFNTNDYKNIIIGETWDKGTYTATNPKDSSLVLQNVLTETSGASSDPLALYVPNTYDKEYIDLDTINADSIPSSSEVYDWSKYTGIKMKSFAKYHYVYNATNKAMYRSSDTSTPLEENVVENGWSIEDINNKTYLVFNEFAFETGADKALEIVGDANVIVKGNNVIEAKCYQYTGTDGTSQSIDNTHYGIYVNSGSTLTTSGDGSITVSKTSINGSSITGSSNKFVPLYAKGALNLGNATHSFVGENYGIESTSTVTLAGCNMDVSGATKAISAASVVTDNKYYENIVKSATVSGATQNNKKVSEIAWANCTAAQVKGQVNYSLRYDATTGKMYKVSSDGTIVTELKSMDNINENDMLVDYIPGWSVDGNKLLTLEDFNFSTAADICLEILGDAKVYIDYAATNENGNNPYYIGGLKPYFDASSRTLYGIKVKGNLELSSDDTLYIKRIENGVTSPNSGTFVGIGIDKGSYNGNLIINNGTYNLNSGVDVGIDYLTEGGRTAVEDGIFAVEATSFALRYLTDTSKEPVELKCGTNANFILKSSNKVSNVDNFRLHQTGEYRTVVVENTEGSANYPAPCDFTTSNYVKLGTWNNFYFLFDGTNLYRAWKDDLQNEVKSSPYTSAELTSMNLSISNNTLHLNNTTFDSTMADTCLKIVGVTTGLDITGTNLFESQLYHRSAMDNDDLTKYGIVIESDNHTFSGTGTLTVGKGNFKDRTGYNSDNDFIAMDMSAHTIGAIAKLEFKDNGTYSFTGESDGINIGSSTITMNGGNLTTSGESGISIGESTLTINSGTLTTTGTVNGMVYDGSGSIDLKAGACTITGGTYGIVYPSELTALKIASDVDEGIKITGNTQTITSNNIDLDYVGEYKTAVKEVQKKSGGTETYPVPYDFATYTYAEIGTIVNYYYEYYSDNNYLYKKWDGGQEYIQPEEQVPGLERKKETYTYVDDDGVTQTVTDKGVLTLTDFELDTAAKDGLLRVVGENTKVVLVGTNKLTSRMYYNGVSETTDSITSGGFSITADNHVFEGDSSSSLTVNKLGFDDKTFESTKFFKAMYVNSKTSDSSSKVYFNGGTYDISGEQDGITLLKNSTLLLRNSARVLLMGTWTLNYKGTEPLKIACSEDSTLRVGSAQIRQAGNSAFSCGSVTGTTKVDLDYNGPYKTYIKYATKSGVTTDYPGSSTIQNYEAVEITGMPKYFYQFNADAGTLVKAYYNSNNEYRGIETLPATGTNYSVSGNTLTLDGFEFETASKLAFLIEGSSSKVVLNGDNKITSVVYYNEGTETSDKCEQGITISGSNHTFEGSGTLTVDKKNFKDLDKYVNKTNHYYAICGNPVGSTDAEKATAMLTINSGTYNINGYNFPFYQAYGNLTINGGELNINSTADHAWRAPGILDINGGNIYVEACAGVGLVQHDQGTSSLSVSNGCLEFNVAHNAIVNYGGALDIEAAAYVRNTAYDGNRVEDPTTFGVCEDFVANFETYRQYHYVYMEPVVRSVNISWGDLAYTGTEKWNASKLQYDCTFTATNGGDEINVSNAGSNIPIVAELDYSPMTFTYNSFTHDVGGGFSANIDPEEDDDVTVYKIGAKDTLNSKLVLDTINYTGYSMENSNQTIGNVTVTISDYYN